MDIFFEVQAHQNFIFVNSSEIGMNNRIKTISFNFVLVIYVSY